MGEPIEPVEDSQDIRCERCGSAEYVILTETSETVDSETVLNIAVLHCQNCWQIWTLLNTQTLPPGWTLDIPTDH